MLKLFHDQILLYAFSMITLSLQEDTAYGNVWWHKLHVLDLKIIVLRCQASSCIIFMQLIQIVTSNFLPNSAGENKGRKKPPPPKAQHCCDFFAKYSWVKKGSLLYGATVYNANLETYYKFRHSGGFSNPRLQFVSASGIFPCSNCSSSAGAGLVTSESADAYCFPLVSAWAWCYVLFIRNLQL